jgi:DNA modification methylase
MNDNLKILCGDWIEQLRTLPDQSVQCCVTSPPYWGLRNYGVAGQLGMEKTPEEYVSKLVAGFQEVRRVLRDNGTLWMNMGDSYANDERSTGLKPKDLVGIPWRVAFDLQADGWYLRSEITWCKKAPMPESVADRPTSATEKIFLLTKSDDYYYDADAVRNPPSEEMLKQVAEGYNGEATKLFEDVGVQNASDVKRRIIENARKRIDKQRGHSRRHAGFNDRWDHLTKSEQMACGSNMRNYWVIGPEPYAQAHFATFPTEIPRRCILAGSKPGDTILDPFGGSGTTGMVSLELGRNTILIELNPKYVNLIEQRTNITPGLQLV